MKKYFGLIQFMRKRNLFGRSLKGTITTHVSSVHEKKKSFKNEICDYKFSQKGD